MKYMVNTIVRYILGESKNNPAHTLRFVLPSYPPEVLFGIGIKIEQELSRIVDKKIDFKYEIAYALGKKWLQGTPTERKIFDEVRRRHWYNEKDNLTCLRHATKSPDADSLIVILAGYEDIQDQASLADFFHLDQQSLWEICLNQSFEGWVIEALQEHGVADGDKETIARIADVFKDLYQFGLADPLQVSRYLETKDFKSAIGSRDALKIVLTDLSPFGLPNMIGLERHSDKRLSDYIDTARKFFNYSSFLDESQKKRAKKKVELFFEENQNGFELDQETLGTFSDWSEFAASLQQYIDEGSPTERAKLERADFVYICDKVLKYKSAKKSGDGGKEQVTRLEGNALEVFLHALWLVLADCKKTSEKSFSLDDITQITFSSLEFKHQYDKDEKEKAENFLQLLLGGIDEYLIDHINIGETEDAVKIESCIAPKRSGSQLNYTSAGNAEPSLRFEVAVSGNGFLLREKFAWSLGKNSQPRFLVELYNWVLDQYYKDKNIILPVASIQYVNEMFMATNAEDVIRIFNTALAKGACSLLDLCSDFRQNDCLKNDLYKLAQCYQEFLDEYSHAGFFAALNDKFDLVRQAYLGLLNHYLLNDSETLAGPLIMKAFMFVPNQFVEQQNWQWKKSLNCGIVTPIHPALLQMIYHQYTYLCESFCSYMRKALKQAGVKGLAERHWYRLVDLSEIKRPILGLLDEKSRLNTNAKSYGYIHLVGSPEKEYSTTSSRLLIQYDDSEDDDISDSELFHQTQEATLIERILSDYCELHSYANDGLNIGIYSGGPIQQMIAGIDAFLSHVVYNNHRIYSLNLTVFSDNPDDTGVVNLLNAWKERWQESEGNTQRRYYANTRISVYYKVVPERDLSQLEKLIRGTDLDIMFLSTFTNIQKSRFQPLKDDGLHKFDDYLKFPLLEKVSCLVDEGGATERQLVLSNRQFELSTLHSEVMARLYCEETMGVSTGENHIVVSTSDFQPWEIVIDAAHKNSVWVVCIDPIVDDNLIRKKDLNREVIGFGTGVGPHGELNFTISTEQFCLSDIMERMSDQLCVLLDNNDKDLCSRLARELIREASMISGLSVVRATGPSQYVRDFVAYALVRKLLPRDEKAFCDELISLDAFLHWFEFGPNDMRPDLLRLRTVIEDGVFKIKVQIIECKLAQESEGYLEKALQQVEEGLKQLVPKFRPRQKTVPLGIEDDQGGYPPDQRYWWMQLHRLISSRGRVKKTQYQDAVQALERLSDGFYAIEWQAAVVAFWTDANNRGEVEPKWDFSIDGQEMSILSAQFGKDSIRKVSLGEMSLDVFRDGLGLRYEPVQTQVEAESSVIDEKQMQSFERTMEKVNEQLEHVTVEKTTGEWIPVSSEQSCDIPRRIFLGTTINNRKIYWEFGHPDLPNRHLLIFGASGTGKTYTVQAMMAELSKCGINSLIIDYTEGFTNHQLEPVIHNKLNPKQHIVRREPLAINPFRKQCSYIDDEPLEDTPGQVAQRVTGVFDQVFRFGEQQKSVLYNAIQLGVSESGNSFNLKALLDKLEEIRLQGGPTAGPAITVINKIKPFVDMNPFGKEEPESWEKLFLDPTCRCHVLQLAGFMKDSARLITEFSLIDLYWYYRTKGNKDRPRVIVLDEIQNLDHRLESPLGQFLTEGRKFGISLILATQTLSNLAKDERDRLFQASHKLFFKPADTEIKSFAQLLADATNDHVENWIQRLSSLERGQCYSLGYAYNEATERLEVNKAFKIKINTLEERF